MGLNTQNTVSANGHVWKIDNRYSILLAGMVCLLFIQMIVPDGFNYNLKPGELPTSGSALSRLIWMSLLVMGVLFTVWRAGLAWLLVRSLNPFFLLLIFLAVYSLYWSIEPSLTVRRLVRLATFVFVCSAFVLSAWHARRFQNVVRSVLTLVLFGSIVFVFVSPRLAIEQSTSAELVGAWHGLATQKNGLGALACFGVIFWFHAWLTREVKPMSALIGGSIAAICLVFSRSSTSIGTTVVVMTLLVMLLRMPSPLRWIRPFLVSMMAVLILLYAIAMLKIVPGMSFILDPIVALTGKNLTFSGRTEIWAIIAEHIKLHPLMGTGYQAYWTPQPIPGKPSYVFLDRMQGFYPGETHNGYLDVINDLGWVGLFCLMAYFFTYIRHSLQLFEIDSNQAALYLAIFFQQAITNLSEAHWFNVQSVDFVIMTVATLSLGRSLLEQRLRTVFGDPYSSIDGNQDDLSVRMQTGYGRFQQYRNMTL